MALQDIDFEGTNVQGQESVDDSKSNVLDNKEDVTHLDGNDVDDITNNTVDESAIEDNQKGESKDDNPSTGELNVGDQIEIDGVTYTVAKNGDIVNEKGEVFKESKDVADWLKSVNVEDEDSENGITLSSIQDSIGITITNEQGEPVEFTNDAAGVNAYVNSVIELKSKDLQEAAVNRLYSENPLLKQFQDYVQLTGTARGFGDIPDRSKIKLDKDDEHQLIAVIKMAAQEFGNKSLNDNYINYLKDSGSLYDEARLQLEALVDKDKEYRKTIETKAAEQRKQEADRRKEYWEKVNNLINSRVINGYRLPNSFTKEIDGKKTILTPSDFFNYLSEARYDDNNGNKITAYQNDLNKLTDDEFLAREMLDAWLMFTGGTYKDLIDMAVKEEQVRKLVVKSKQNRSSKSVRVVKKQTGKANIDDIIF